jgi:hypothetical protein
MEAVSEPETGAESETEPRAEAEVEIGDEVVAGPLPMRTDS